MKNKKALLLACLMALPLAGCSQSSQTTEEPGTDSACSADEEFGCSYETKSDESSFTSITFDEAIAFFEDGKSGLLYFGFPGCPWCEDVVPILKEEAQENDVEVYYIRTRDDDKNRLYSDEQKEQIIPYLGDYMSDNEEGELTLYVPLIVAVQDGKAIAGHEGTVDGHDASERDMTDEEKQEAEQEILEVIQAAKQ